MNLWLEQGGQGRSIDQQPKNNLKKESSASYSESKQEAAGVLRANSDIYQIPNRKTEIPPRINGMTASR